MKRINLIGVILSITLIFSFVFSPVEGRGTTYYVALNGRDNAAGSKDRPFATLQKAAEVANPGDMVYVRGGTYYTGSINLSKRASTDAPIVFQAYPGEQVILDGKRAPANTSLFSVSGHYYEIRNFTIQNAKRTAISVWAGGHITISGNTITNSKRGAIYGAPEASHLTISHNVIYRNSRNNAKQQYEHRGGWTAAVVTSGKRDVIENNFIYENWGEGIGVYGTNHRIRGNTLHDNYSVEIYVNNVSRTTIESNFIYSNNDPRFLRLFGSDLAAAIGISIANENATHAINKNRILNNIIIGKRVWGISQWGGEARVPTGLQNTVIANNTVVVYGVHGVFKVENNIHHNSLIANNIFYQLNPNRPDSAIATRAGLSFKNNAWIGVASGKGRSKADHHQNPMFVNINGRSVYDFRLNASSPLINRGTQVNVIKTDYFGIPRSGTYDIGAHEAGAGVQFDDIPLP